MLGKRETIENKGIGTDFMLDNILKPLLTDLKNNSLSFLIGQLIGKRDINQKDIGTDFMLDNILKPLLNDLKNNSLSFLVGQLTGWLGKRDVDSKELNINVIINTIFLPILNTFNDKLNQFLQQDNGLMSLFEKPLIDELKSVILKEKFQDKKYQ